MNPLASYAHSFHAWPPKRRGWAVGLVLVPAVGLTLSRALGWEFNALAWAVAFTPIVALGSLFLVVFATLSRSTVFLAASIVVGVAQVSWIAPLYVGASRDVELPADLVVMTTNMMVGQADTDQIVGYARDRRVDFLATQEMNDDALARLRTSGVDELFAYSWIDYGNGTWSKYPILADASRDLRMGNRFTSAVVDRRGERLTFVNVHPAAPLTPGHQEWSEDQPKMVDQLARLAGPAIVAGDFNATLDHRVIRDLQALGYQDAAQAGSLGFKPTWPQLGVFNVPLFAIDHVMYRDIAIDPVSIETLRIANSDHRALVVGFASQTTS